MDTHANGKGVEIQVGGIVLTLVPGGEQLGLFGQVILGSDSIHEGGELGYSLSHAYGAAFDNPDLIVACLVGDGETETGPAATATATATARHSNKFPDPLRDGAVLPILHLNGYKNAKPTVLARISRDELEALFKGYGYTPYLIEGSDPAAVHQAMAATLDQAMADIQHIQQAARLNANRDANIQRPR